MEAKFDPKDNRDSKDDSKGDAKSDSKPNSGGGSASFKDGGDANTNANAGVVDADGRQWWRVAKAGLPVEGARLHTSINGRFVTVFRHAGVTSFRSPDMHCPSLTRYAPSFTHPICTVHLYFLLFVLRLSSSSSSQNSIPFFVRL